MEDVFELAMKAAEVKADQVRDTGAKVLAAPCAICRAQLPKVMDHYKLEVEVFGVHHLVAKALKRG
jgi:Fe-S oxidoreductase